jgi:sugar phosphate isomerase/epimerase
MISRREFLAAGAMSGLAIAASSLAKAAPQPTSLRFGVQLYVLRTLLAKDFDGTLAKVAEIGITDVEFAGFYGRTASQVRASLSKAGLKAVGAHCLLAAMPDDEVRRMIDFCGEAGTHYMIAAVPSLKSISADHANAGDVFKHIDLVDFQWSAERFNVIGARVRDAGMRFGYHNHNIEFQKYGDIVAFDEIMRLTDPSVVAIEFDTGNAIAGGADPYIYLKKYPHRFELAHVKEWAAPFTPAFTANFPKYVPFGQGTTDWKKHLAALQKDGVHEVFIEQDGTADGRELEVVRQVYQFLKSV